jgi:hypothetical protein
VPYIAAAVVAGGLLLAEQIWRQRLWFTFPASAWWAGRLAVEAGIALALTAALRSVPSHILSINGILLGVVAGMAAPRVFGRTQVAIKDHNLNLINLAYVRATEPLDEQIDESSAEVQRQYVNQVIRPAAREGRLNPTDIAQEFIRHLSGRHGMPEADRVARISYIKTILDDTIPDDEKVGALVLKAWEIGAYKALQTMLKPLPRRRYGAKTTAERFLRFLRIRRA